MALNIIGISAYYHDSACCLMVDGQLLYAAEEERFTRRKHDPGFPAHSLRFCLEEAKLTIDKVDRVAFYEQPVTKLGRQIWMCMQTNASERLNRELRARLDDANRFERDIRAFGYQGEIDFEEHHMSHAASSFFFSGFSEAAVLTADGVGEWTTTSYMRGTEQGLEPIGRVEFPHSLGLFYSAITSYLGFAVNNDEYKVMGLAPYGMPCYTEQLWQVLELRGCGDFRLNMKYFDFVNGDRMYSGEFVELFGQPPREKQSSFTSFHKNLAKSLQVVLEEALLENVSYLHQQCSSENLCMAGGVALNCVANRRILTDGPFENLFVQPASSDAGGALGAAALAHLRHTGERPGLRRLDSVQVGPAFSTASIKKLLRATSLNFEDYSDNLRDLLAAAAQRLADGKVMGWFSGRMEFGPRALGSRSILADPQIEGMREHINALVKKRESFRPFAPSVLKEKAFQHFEIAHPAPFMLETCQVISDLALPAVTHVDGSARVQTVDKRDSPRFHSLIEEFYNLTGCPVLLNTSFNVQGEPIACTPLDALICFVRSGLDCLMLEELIIDRDAIPKTWKSSVSQMPVELPGAVNRNVYTML